jgi:hypothetical protein
MPSDLVTIIIKLDRPTEPREVVAFLMDLIENYEDRAAEAGIDDEWRVLLVKAKED